MSNDLDELRKRHGNLTFDEIMQILEEEMEELQDDNDPYLPLKFDEDYG